MARANYPTLSLLCILTLSGCAHPVQPYQAIADTLALQGAKVSKADLMLRFGAPLGKYEDGKIIIWRVGRTGDGLVGPASRVVQLQIGDPDGPNDWEGSIYDLVVSFDDQAMLKRYELIPVRER